MPEQLSLTVVVISVGCAMLIGMSKTGLSGLGLLVVPIFAGVFGGRPSVGIVLPMLIIADVFAVIYYNRHADWKYVFRLLPWALAGILLALWVGSSISDVLFRKIIGLVVLTGIGLMIFQDVRKYLQDKNKGSEPPVPTHPVFSAAMGLTGGFATMIGNAAGPVLSLYLLSMRLPKNQFIGTGAWFFLIVNLIKVPLHVFFWKTISLSSIKFNLMLALPILAGAVAGVYLVKLFPERWYRIFIIVSTVLAAGFLF